MNKSVRLLVDEKVLDWLKENKNLINDVLKKAMNQHISENTRYVHRCIKDLPKGGFPAKAHYAPGVEKGFKKGDYVSSSLEPTKLITKAALWDKDQRKDICGDFTHEVYTVDGLWILKHFEYIPVRIKRTKRGDVKLDAHKS